MKGMKTALKFILYIAGGYGLVSLVILASVNAVTKGPFERVAEELPKLKQEAKSVGMEFDLGKIIDEKPIPDSENAAGDYMPVSFRFRELKNDYDHGYNRWNTRLRDPSPGERRKLLDDLHATDRTVDALEVAALKPHLRFRTDLFTDSYGSNSNNPIASSIELLVARIKVEAQFGMVDKAFHELAMAYAICKQLQDLPGLSPIRHQSRNYWLTDTAAASLVPAVENLPGGLDRLEKLLRSSRRPADLIWAVRTEATISFKNVREWSKGEENWNQILALSNYGYVFHGVDTILSDRVPATISKELITKTFEARYLQCLIPAFRELQRSHDPFTFVSQVDSELNRTLAIEDSTYEICRVLAHYWTNALERAISRDVGRDLVLGLIQIARYKVKKGHLPKTLKEAGVSSLDPFTKGPLHYLYLGSEAVIYSVGSNRVDDGGLPQSRDLKIGYEPAKTHKVSLTGTSYYEY